MKTRLQLALLGDFVTSLRTALDEGPGVALSAVSSMAPAVWGKNHQLLLRGQIFGRSVRVFLALAESAGFFLSIRS